MAIVLNSIDPEINHAMSYIINLSIPSKFQGVIKFFLPQEWDFSQKISSMLPINEDHWMFFFSFKYPQHECHLQEPARQEHASFRSYEYNPVFPLRLLWNWSCNFRRSAQQILSKWEKNRWAVFYDDLTPCPLNYF